MEKKLLPNEVENQIKEVLYQMNKEVNIILFTKEIPGEMCGLTIQFLNEIANLNKKIKLVIKNVNNESEINKYNINLFPSFVLLDHNNEYKNVKFNGIPAGHEINSFLTSLLEISNSPMLSDELKTRIDKIKHKTNIKVFVTLGCPHCPDAVSNANRIAMSNSNVQAEMIEAQTFLEISKKYNVSSVPKIVINDKYELLGNQPIEEIIKKIEQLSY